jgi:hypothetical protein
MPFVSAADEKKSDITDQYVKKTVLKSMKNVDPPNARRELEVEINISVVVPALTIKRPHPK